MTKDNRKRFFLLGLAYLGFISLGLPDGAMGVAWPSIRRTFGLELDAIAPLFALGTAGGMLSSFLSGRAVSRWGAGIVALCGCLLTAFAVFGFSISPAWGFVVFLGAFGGFGAGAIDAGLNTYVATRFTARHVNWLHACWGLGVSIGPLIMTAAIAARGSWRIGYATIAVLQLCVALLFFITLNRWTSRQHANNDANQQQPTPIGETLRMPVTWISMLVFMVYSGSEVAAGQWVYSLFVEARSIEPVRAGIWVSFYWASLTAGRFLVGLIANRFKVSTLLRVSMIGALSGAALLTVAAGQATNVAALMILGVSFATIFPSMMAETPMLAGSRHAPNAIGFQVAAAGLGIATLPGLLGFIARRAGLEMTGPFLLAACGIMLLLHELRLRRARSPRDLSRQALPGDTP